MSDWYLFRADWPHHCRRRSGLRRDRDVDKMPKEMLIWHELTYKKDILTNCRSNDRFGLKSRPRRAEVKRSKVKCYWFSISPKYRLLRLRFPKLPRIDLWPFWPLGFPTEEISHCHSYFWVSIFNSIEQNKMMYYMLFPSNMTLSRVNLFQDKTVSQHTGQKKAFKKQWFLIDKNGVKRKNGVIYWMAKKKGCPMGTPFAVTDAGL